jgi:hypothetical protein
VCLDVAAELCHSGPSSFTSRLLSLNLDSYERPLGQLSSTVRFIDDFDNRLQGRVRSRGTYGFNDLAMLGTGGYGSGLSDQQFEMTMTTVVDFAK